MKDCVHFFGKKTQIMVKNEIKYSLNFIKWKLILHIFIIMGNILKNHKNLWILGKQSQSNLPTLYLKGVMGIGKSSLLPVAYNVSVVLTQKVSIRLRTL
jgi:hypothetical protein